MIWEIGKKYFTKEDYMGIYKGSHVILESLPDAYDAVVRIVWPNGMYGIYKYVVPTTLLEDNE